MKTRLFKTCSWILVLAILINLLPAQIIALELQAEDVAAPVTSEQVSESAAESKETTVDISNATILMELVENRTEFSKEYKLSNGMNMAIVYPEAVHYKKDGQWKDIDNTLQSKGSGDTAAYATTAGAWHAEFPQQLRDGAQVTITKNGYTVGFEMIGEVKPSTNAGKLQTTTLTAISEVRGQVHELDYSKQKEQAQHPEIVRDKLKSRMSYSNVFTNTDIVYDVTSSQVKESIVISQYNASVCGYLYILDTGTLVPVLNTDNSIDLLVPNSTEVVMTMPAPFMVDNAGSVSNDVAIALEQKGTVWLLAYQMPMEWLEDEERSWPVVLDPAVIANSNSANILDNYVSQNYVPPYDAGGLYCGRHPTQGAARTYLQYNYLPTLDSSDVILYAELALIPLNNNYDPMPSAATTIEAHKVNADWNSRSITWDTQPGYNHSVEDYARVTPSGNCSWVITDVVRDWYRQGNWGIMLKAPDSIESGTTADWKKFCSVDYSVDPNTDPSLMIIYRSFEGLENYWDYTTVSAGRAGVGYVNNYTGNLTWVHSDIGFGGNRMPVSISHIYNASESDENAYGLGYGWRTNYHQTVEKIENTDESGTVIAEYAWTDGDGTKHYFIKGEEANVFQDEDGLDLTLTKAGSTYTIADKIGNTSTFAIVTLSSGKEVGRLVSISNNRTTDSPTTTIEEEASSISITYANDTSMLISKITDGAGRAYNFTYSNGLLTRIRYTSTGTEEISYVSFEYTNSQLTTIKDKDAEICNYLYDAVAVTFNEGTSALYHLLRKAVDIDGYNIQYTYSATAPKRVVGIAEFDGATAGSSLTIEYGHNQTTFTDHNGHIQITQFNDWGNVISIQDDQGRAQFGQYAVNNHGDNSGKGNQLTLSSKMQNTVGNRVRDNSFEVNDYWPALSTAITASRSSGTAYMGSYALKMVRATAGAESGMHCANIQLAAGKTYTLSGYVKTGNGSAYLAINDGTITVRSEPLAPNSDWTRLQVSYTNTTSAAKTISIQLLTTEAGTTYLDCVQLELAATPSRYSLITHNDFRSGGSPAFGWTGSGLTSNDKLASAPSAAAPELEKTAFKFVGSPTAAKKLSQVVKVSGTKNDCFVLSGWAMADSAPLTQKNEARMFSLTAKFQYTDGTTSDAFIINFNPDVGSEYWQYAAGALVAEKAYSSITVTIDYSYNVNTAYFDGIQLYKENFGTSYTYNDDGEVTRVEDLQKQTTTYEYNTKGDLAKIIQNNKAKMTYEYDDYHNVIKATTATGIVYEFVYDEWGNNISVSIINGDSEITSTAEYSDDGNRLVSTTDALGNKTTYHYDEDTNVLVWVQYPEDTEVTQTDYSYDSMYRLASAEAAVDSGYTLYASYTYEDDLLTEITTNSTIYTFTYGIFSQASTIEIGNWKLASYTYTNDQDRYLNSLDYGNDDKVQYTYDAYGRVTQETFEDGDTVTYQYDNSGALATVTDSATGITTTYYYDLTDRLMKYVESGTGYNHSVGYEYDTLNNLTSLVETINGVKHSTSYTYDDDNRIDTVTHNQNGQNVINTDYTYDRHGRVEFINTWCHGYSSVSKDYCYNYIGFGKTSGQIINYQADTPQFVVNYDITYDDNGNITSVTVGTMYTTYAYDSANQLIREDNSKADKTWVWSYDNAGNILSKTEYAYTAGELGEAQDTVLYVYGDAEWGDLLTSYDGNSITYDGIGNPLSDGTWTYTWEHGRELVSMDDGDDHWIFAYDANGMRTKRTNGDTTYTYIYNGSQLVQMTVSGNTLNFIYDASGAPVVVIWNGTPYYYVTTLQGDIQLIIDLEGEILVSYDYDAWGNILEIEGTMADTLGVLNPLTYRGYVYDHDTGLYYLQSRYYDPEWGRFLNADGATSTGQGLLGNNMFAYCLNNPVNGCDPCGACFHRLDFWNDCDTCKNKTLWDYVKDSVDVWVHGVINSSPCVITASVARFVHYERNIINQTFSEEELIIAGNEPLGEDQDKFHQNNQINGRNRKYVFNKGWFSSEIVFYSDGTVNDTPEDRGTLNVYYGDNWFGNYVLHGIYDVVPYMIWGNSYDDSTTIIDRILMALR